MVGMADTMNAVLNSPGVMPKNTHTHTQNTQAWHHFLQFRYGTWADTKMEYDGFVGLGRFLPQAFSSWRLLAKFEFFRGLVDSITNLQGEYVPLSKACITLLAALGRLEVNFREPVERPSRDQLSFHQQVALGGAFEGSLVKPFSIHLWNWIKIEAIKKITR